MLLKILIAGAKTDCVSMKNMLKEYEVLTSQDSFEVLEMIDNNPDIGIIVLSLNLPGFDGFGVLEKLQNNAKYREIHALILTCPDELENEMKGLELGAVDCLRRPIIKEYLVAKIKVHFQLLEKELEKKNRRKQDLMFDTIFQQAPIGIAIYQHSNPFGIEKNNIARMNPMFQQITGRTEEEHILHGWAKFSHPDDLEEDLEHFQKLRSGKISNYEIEKRYIKPDGSLVWLHLTAATLDFYDESEYGYICLIQDITKRKTSEEALLESERGKDVLLSHLPGLAYRCNYDGEWTMQYVSRGCLELTGYSSDSLLHNKERSFNDIIAQEYRIPLKEEWKRAIETLSTFKYEYQIVTSEGKRKWVLEMGQGVYDEKADVEALEGIILDISVRKKFENTLKYNSEHDIWTGLHNWTSLKSILEKDRGYKAGRKRGLISVNLSAIQLLSMTYGFHYTMELIKNVARTLNLYSTDKYQLFRTYENRFTFYCKDYEDQNELVEFCKTIAHILEFLLLTERVKCGIGIYEIDDDKDTDLEQVFKKLLIASERAVDIYDGDFGICFYDDIMESEVEREDYISHELARILKDAKNSGLRVQYQPILELESNKICGFEALARLHTHKFGIISPLEFIPIAEKTKLIIPLGQIIFRQALEFLGRIKKAGYTDMKISINVSATELLRDDYIENTLETIKRMQIDPESIGIEITESVLASNYEEINHTIGRLKDYGLDIAIDDFGTGYSSLASASELNANQLKIDKSFVDKLLSNNPKQAIVEDIVSMAQKLGYTVIAEGVEEERQKRYLINCRCDKIQGYLISKPLDEIHVFKLLRKEMDRHID